MYKYETAFAWLEHAVQEGTVSVSDLLLLISENCDSDMIIDSFQSQMDEDGFFEEEQEKAQTFYYTVDLDERGIFAAHVESEDGKCMFSFSNQDSGNLWIVEDGYMENVSDLEGLCSYLVENGILPRGSELEES